MGAKPKNIAVDYLSHPVVWLVAGFAVRLFFANWTETFSTDVYYYVLKSLEITRGNFEHLPELSIGWPYVLSFPYSILHPGTYAQAVVIARILSAVFDTATLYIICKIAAGISGATGKTATGLLYVCLPLSVIIGPSGMPDSAFTLLFTLGIWQIVRSPVRIEQYIAAGIAGAACVWLRPNGILSVPLFAGMTYLTGSTPALSAMRRAAVIVTVSVLLCIPLWAGRMYQFGSPFSYGAATKLFVGSLDASLSPNVQNPTIAEFFRTTPPAALYGRYVVSFVREYIRAFVFPFGAFDLLSAVVLAGSLLVFALPGKPPVIRILSFAFLFWSASLLPTLPVHQKARHLLPLMPLSVVLSVYTYGRIRRLCGKRINSVFIPVILGILITGGLVSSYRISTLIRTNQSRDTQDWAQWSAAHLSGLVVTMDTYAVQRLLIDRTLSDGSISHIIRSGESAMRFSFPGYFSSLTEEIGWLHRIHASYIIVDAEYLRRAPYLRDIFDGYVQNPALTPVYTNAETSNPWKVTIYSVR